MSLRLTRLDGDTGVETGTYHLEDVPGRPGRSRTSLPLLPPARYQVQPVYAGTDSAAGPARPFVVVSSSLEEMQTWQDRRHLRGLARNWGGPFLDGNDDLAGSWYLCDLSTDYHDHRGRGFWTRSRREWVSKRARQLLTTSSH